LSGASPGTQPVSALRHPALELLGRYRAVLAAAWQMRHELAGPQRLAHERAFLPAALSLQETPVHPAPRRVIAALVALLALALAWSWWGQVDIVAVADGRIVVGERTKLIQPLEAAVVRAIHVREGDRVRAGSPLVDLDPTNAVADTRSVQEQRRAIALETSRARSLLAALQQGSLPASAEALAIDPSAQAHLAAEWADIRMRLARLDAEASRRAAEMATVQELIAKTEATLPLARQREADIQSLSAQGFVSGHVGQDRARERLELEGDLATQRSRLRETRAALAESNQSRLAATAEIRRTLNDRLARAELEGKQLEQQNAKSAQREQLTRLSAPVDGTVQQLAVHSAGALVTQAQPLMVLVPAAAEVMAEVTVNNKDIGFVQAGLSAVVKLETFPFTRHGTVPETVRSVSADAVMDESRGAVFKALLVLDQPAIQINGRRVALQPGMNLAVEIKTGRRRVLDYLVSPLERHLHEPLRER
jgi:hemolysin D